MHKANSFLIAGLLLIPSLAAASAQGIDLQALLHMTLPQELGRVSEAAQPVAASSSPKIVILIEDAHVNAGAQRNLAGIIRYLADAYQVRLILVEGGDGDVGLSYMREWMPEEMRRSMAEDYLAQGMLSGEEYADLVSDQPLVLWGIEDRALYEANFQAFLEANELQPALAKHLAFARQLVKALLPKLGNAPLRQYLSQRSAFAAGTLELSGYVRFLGELCLSLGIDGGLFPHTVRFLEIQQSEQTKDAQQLALEQKQVIEQIVSQCPREAVKPLIDAAKALQAKTGSRQAYNQELARLIQAYSISLEPFPQVKRYLRREELKEAFDARQLLNETREMEKAAGARLAASEEERALVSFERDLLLRENLVGLKWQPADYEEYSREKNAGWFSHWLPWLKERAAKAGLPWEAQQESVALQVDSDLNRMVRFYQAARERESAMALHVADKLLREKGAAAVLIVGGFHTESLRALLHEQGLATIVVSPAVSEKNDPDRYATVMRRKRFGKFKAQETMAEVRE